MREECSVVCDRGYLKQNRKRTIALVWTCGENEFKKKTNIYKHIYRGCVLGLFCRGRPRKSYTYRV